MVASARRARILLVDDDEDVVMSLVDALEACGHVVGVARDGCAALELAAELRPEVAILDLELPEMNGYELARRLKASRASPELRLIAYSGGPRNVERERSFEVAFDVFLHKPGALDGLTDAVEEPRAH